MKENETAKFKLPNLDLLRSPTKKERDNSYKEEIEISTSGGRNINEGKSEAKND